MLEKKYNHLEVENGKYEKWVKNGYFEEREGGKPYAIVIPPPNVTGKLHLGHAWDTTLQDIIIRFKKMQGFNAIWIHLRAVDAALFARVQAVLARNKAERHLRGGAATRRKYKK